MKASLKIIAKRGLEITFVLALVLLAFLVILLTLNEVFPTGQNLFNLVRPGGDYRRQAGNDKRSRNLRLYTETGEQTLGEDTGITAILTDMKNSVKSKRAAHIAWKTAVEGMTLYDRDAVQTFQKSTAKLSFDENSFLEIDENSLIIVRKLERDPFLRENRTVVVLMDGQLTGEVSSPQREGFNLEVVAPGAVTRVRSTKGQDKSARFKMAVRPDESSILTVLEGTADLLFEDETIEVRVDQIVKILPGKAPVYISPPPEPPVLISPEDGKEYSFRDVPPMVAFGWREDQKATAYHFILAMDKQFDRIFHQDTVSDNFFSHGNLKPGEYFWRVSSSNSDQEGTFSKVRSFKLIQDLQAPHLEVDYPDSSVKDKIFELKGTTEPDARIFVSGVSVEPDEHGEFVHSLELEPGPNIVVVEAVDKVGNVAYLSQIVILEF